MKRLLIACTEEEEEAFLELARRYKVSASLLGQHAIQQLLANDKDGIRPMLKPSTSDAIWHPEAFASVVSWVDDPS